MLLLGTENSFADRFSGVVEMTAAGLQGAVLPMTTDNWALPPALVNRLRAEHIPIQVPT